MKQVEGQKSRVHFISFHFTVIMLVRSSASATFLTQQMITQNKDYQLLVIMKCTTFLVFECIELTSAEESNSEGPMDIVISHKVQEPKQNSLC